MTIWPRGKNGPIGQFTPQTLTRAGRPLYRQLSRFRLEPGVLGVRQQTILQLPDRLLLAAQLLERFDPPIADSDTPCWKDLNRTLACLNHAH